MVVGPGSTVARRQRVDRRRPQHGAAEPQEGLRPTQLVRILAQLPRDGQGVANDPFLDHPAPAIEAVGDVPAAEVDVDAVRSEHQVRAEKGVVAPGLPHHVLRLPDPVRRVRDPHEGALDDLLDPGRGAECAVHDGIRFVVLADVPDCPFDPDQIGDFADEVVGVGVGQVGDRIQSHDVVSQDEMSGAVSPNSTSGQRIRMQNFGARRPGGRTAESAPLRSARSGTSPIALRRRRGRHRRKC